MDKRHSRSKTSITIIKATEQVTKKPYSEPEKRQEKKQVEMLSNLTDNQVKSEEYNQAKKQVKMQYEDKKPDNTETIKRSQLVQRTIFDVIKENS